MPRTAVMLVLASLLFAPLAFAQNPVDITPDHIAGIQLGMARAKANALLARPVRLDRLEEGFQRLVSGKQKVEVYFQEGTPGVVAVTTWNQALKTHRQIGPCSTIAALKRAYGAKLRPFRRGGRIVAYRLGRLIFTTEDGRRVGVVGLGRTTPAVYVALNAPECR
jgi:hypothetical protein